MNVYEDMGEWLRYRRSVDGQSVGFVPTMGALHDGHASLMKRAAAENDVSVLSIFVNPTQFNDPADLENYLANYQTTLRADLALAEACGISNVILPTASAMYPDTYTYKVTESEMSKGLCGAHRPGHFDGMLTVVLKLLNLARATRAYFGEKDFQQLALVEGMVRAFFIETKIVACPTVRELDGLALSSRNRRLDVESRAKAPLLVRALRTAATATEARRRLEAEGFAIDYVEDWKGRRLGAVSLPTSNGQVRLIDNVAVDHV